MVSICSPDPPKIPPAELPDPLQDDHHDGVQGRGQVCGLHDSPPEKCELKVQNSSPSHPGEGKVV